VTRLRPAKMSPIEVVLIGPGYGESILLNLGDGRWVVIDSCVRRGARNSAALEYLADRGVHVQEDVILVIASHWHDDHVRGLAELVKASRAAQFSCSVALSGEEFLALVKHSIPVPSKFSSGVEEFRKILDVLNGRGLVPHWANGARRILASPTSDISALWTLSPSDRDVHKAMSGFAAASVENNSASRIPAIEPNDAAVAVLVELRNGDAILLGADLEHYRGTNDRGWHAILNDLGRPRRLSSLYKVAHHGSVNSHCPSAWSDTPGCEPRVNDSAQPLLKKRETTCILTPWRRGRYNLPTAADMQRLQSLAASVFPTTDCDQAFGNPEISRKFKGYSFARYMAPAEPGPGVLVCKYEAGAWSVTESMPFS
jgi:hypothetical protein